MPRIALVQFTPLGSQEENLSRAFALAQQAAAEGAELIAFAEFFAYPWFPAEERPTYAYAETIAGRTVTSGRDLARELKVALLLSLYERAGARCFNTAVLVGPSGAILGFYRKKHLPDEPGFRESAHYVPGEDGLPVFTTPMGKIGIQICSDIMFPEGARVLGRKGAELLLVPRASLAASAERFQTVIRAAAITTGAYVATINRAGREGDIEFAADSMVVDPRGNVIARATQAEEVVLADVNLGQVAEVRRGYPFDIKYRPELFRELTEG